MSGTDLDRAAAVCVHRPILWPDSEVMLERVERTG
jgi:hypothetical protein